MAVVGSGARPRKQQLHASLYDDDELSEHEYYEEDYGGEEHAAPRALDEFRSDAVARKERAQALQSASELLGGGWENDEDAELQLALALSASEASAMGHVLPAVYPPPARPPPMPAAQAPFLAAIEARLEAQRQAWLRKQQDEAAAAEADLERGGAAATAHVVPERRSHLKCDEMWGGALSEEEAILSEEDDARAKRRDEEAEHEEAGAWEEEEWLEKDTQWEEDGYYVYNGQANAAHGASSKQPARASTPSAPAYSDDEDDEVPQQPQPAQRSQPPGLAVSSARLPPGLQQRPAVTSASATSRGGRAGGVGAARVGSVEAQKAASASDLRTWALAELRALLVEDLSVVEPETLLEYVMPMEDDEELCEYLIAFVGDAAASFGVDLCERRRRATA